ncbi:MAG: hypothetical protein ISS77_05570 [Phycisphaerae bacterium]|nr:hypothetical protein [Phycisphaerae bacterium]
MKKFAVEIVLVMCFCLLAILSTGCCMPGMSKYDCSQPGQTPEEVKRAQIRSSRLNNQQLNADVESFMLYDEPSKLSPFNIK